MPTENSYEEDDFEGTTDRDVALKNVKQEHMRDSLNMQPSKKQHSPVQSSPDKDRTAPEDDEYEEDR